METKEREEGIKDNNKTLQFREIKKLNAAESIT
jgi:hypothetical protein